MMDNDKDCMLKEITRFLIQVGEHCMECNGKISIEPDKEPTITKPRPKPEIKAESTYMVPTMTAPKDLPKKTPTHNIKLSYLEKWIRTISFEVFTLDQFFKAYPKQRKNKKLNHVISRLISEKKIMQLSKNKFKVIT